MTWEDLIHLRRNGLRPELPVYITNRPLLARNLRDAGVMAILHGHGQKMPVELLDGLDIVLYFENCQMAGRVKRLMDLRGVAARGLYAWCRCGRDLVVTCGPCDSGGEPWAV